jgi:hypothetical protein
MKPPTKTPFSYVVLRYMHDVFTREFVNLGVLVHAPEAGFLEFQKLTTMDRAKGMFPGLHSDSVRDLLRFLESRTGELREQANHALDRNAFSADGLARSLLPTDDSALQWSAPGGGLTEDPEKTLKELFDRLVARHLKATSHSRRDDADVWKPFERELRQRDILSRFQEKVLSVGELRHRFENAWQPLGSYLRLFQPLSFDLLEPSDIVEKAVRWSALIHHLRKANSEFFIYLLLGRPLGNGQSHRAFEQAYETLNEDSAGLRELVPEEDAPKFAAVVEKEIKSAPSN